MVILMRHFGRAAINIAAVNFTRTLMQHELGLHAARYHMRMISPENSA